LTIVFSSISELLEDELSFSLLERDDEEDSSKLEENEEDISPPQALRAKADPSIQSNDVLSSRIGSPLLGMKGVVTRQCRVKIT